MKLIELLGVGVFSLVIVMAVGAVIGSYCWPYAINTWLEFAGKPMSVTGWHGAGLGVVPYFGLLSIPAAVITWIVMLFLGG